MNDIKLIYGKGEITRIDSQIKEAFKILKECKFIEGGVTKKSINKICDLGFDHTHSSGNTFIGKNQVIKLALFTRRPPPIKYRVPTLIYAKYNITPREWDWNFVVAIQPKVDIDHVDEDDYESRKWSKFFDRKLSGVDSHAGNFGLYKKQILLFDW
jgi:hypothetical protein